MLLQKAGGSFSLVSGPRCLYTTMEQLQIAASLDVNNDGRIDLITATDDARGDVDGRALANVYLQGIRLYPVPLNP